MSFVSYQQILSETEHKGVGSNNGRNQPSIGFFNLKNDGEEAVVRFICDSPEQMEILNYHDIKIGDKSRKVNCLRSVYDPVDNCPYCKANTVQKDRYPLKRRFFIKLLQYSKDENGQIVASPKIWERSDKYVLKLKSYLDNYGPLSDIMCKIIRHGVAGSVSTDYEIVPNLNPKIFPESVYKKDVSAFGDYSAFGRLVLDRTYDEGNTFIATGNFPARQNNAEQSRPTYNTQSTAASDFGSAKTEAYVEKATSTVNDVFPSAPVAPKAETPAPSANTSTVDPFSTAPSEPSKNDEVALPWD